MMMIPVDKLRRPRGVRVVQGQSAYERLINSYLAKIQQELEPDQAKMVVAINTQTGEYVLGHDSSEASAAFRKRWPKGGSHICRVDGSPSGRI